MRASRAAALVEKDTMAKNRHQLDEQVVRALDFVLAYLWADEAAYYRTDEGRGQSRMFRSLVLIGQWLHENQRLPEDLLAEQPD